MMSLRVKLKFVWRVTLMAVLPVMGTGAQTLSDALTQGEALGLSVGVSGQVAEVLVEVGETVEKGQILLTLGATPYVSKLEASRAKLSYAKFKLQLLEEDYARQQELYDEGSLSAVDLQLLDLSVKLARSDAATARAALDLANATLAYTKIISPADGKVIAVPLVGQRVSTVAGLPVLIKLAVP
jgi:RND family efflux transporter MFP subunit